VSRTNQPSLYGISKSGTPLVFFRFFPFILFYFFWQQLHPASLLEYPHKHRDHARSTAKSTFRSQRQCNLSSLGLAYKRKNHTSDSIALTRTQTWHRKRPYTFSSKNIVIVAACRYHPVTAQAPVPETITCNYTIVFCISRLLVAEPLVRFAPRS